MEVWSDERALYIWSGEAKANLAPVKEAKLALDYPFRVVPIGVVAPNPPHFTTLPPPAGARILAIGSRSPWANRDYALVSQATSPEGWKRALAWVLGEVEHDPKATTVLDIFVSVFGPETREIPPEELEGEQKIADYIQGRV